MHSIVEPSIDTAKIPSLKILIAEDDPMGRQLMHIILTQEGHSVDLAANGREALEAVKRQKYDIVFMDLQMPVMDGLEASRQIRAWENGEAPRTYIVALTASYLPEVGQALFDAGIDNYVSKPFELDQIHQLMKYGSPTAH